MKRYHFAALISLDDRGYVSALCSETPRPINPKRAMWTIRKEAVTCPKCKARLKYGMATQTENHE